MQKQFNFANNTLSTSVSGTFTDENSLSSIRIAGWDGLTCGGISATLGVKSLNTSRLKIR